MSDQQAPADIGAETGAFFIVLSIVIAFPLTIVAAVWYGLALLDVTPWPLWRQLAGVSLCWAAFAAVFTTCAVLGS